MKKTVINWILFFLTTILMGTIIPRYIGSLSSNYNPLEWSEILNYLPSLIMMSMVFAFIGIWALKKDKENENNNK